MFRREGEYWTVGYEGSVIRLRDSKGLRHLARLLSQPGRELLATDLEAAEGQTSPTGSSGRADDAELGVRPDLGDAGELLDATAKAAYRARLDELHGELEEAEAFNDPASGRQGPGRAGLPGRRAGPGGGAGRPGSAGGVTCRAGQAECHQAIRTAMANLARANPALGRHPSFTIRTGRYCSYSPDPRVAIAWER